MPFGNQKPTGLDLVQTGPHSSLQPFHLLWKTPQGLGDLEETPLKELKEYQLIPRIIIIFRELSDTGLCNNALASIFSSLPPSKPPISILFVVLSCWRLVLYSGEHLRFLWLLSRFQRRLVTSTYLYDFLGGVPPSPALGQPIQPITEFLLLTNENL